MILFLVAVFAVALVAGGVGAVAGFGVGSLLTPLLIPMVGIKLAVAAVAFPHLAGTAVRMWLMWKHVDWSVLTSFGIASALGGLMGALLYNVADHIALTLLLAGLLVFTGLLGVTGQDKRLRFGPRWAPLVGGLSGALGGLVGNQGGIRSAALLGLNIPKHAFVATSSAVGFIVDGARTPVYLAIGWHELGEHWTSVGIASVGVVVGTLLGGRVLHWIPEWLFRRIVSSLILTLGVYLLALIAS